MVNVFFSYSHQDEKMRDEIEKHFSILVDQKVIAPWHDRRMEAGSELNLTIDSYIEKSDIILLLVSPDFLASYYCYKREMERALERHREGAAKVIPIILEHCDWQSTPLKELVAMPRDGKPISECPNINKVLNEITQEIRKIAEHLNKTNNPKLAHMPLPQKQEAVAVIVENIRSSNLRVKKQFSDYDKDKFLMDAFEYMAKFFSNSLEELKKRNEDFQCDYRRIDSNAFTATIYRHGRKATSCTIRYKGNSSHLKGITYSYAEVGDSSFNDSISVQDDGHMMYLHPMLNILGADKDEKMSLEGASEYYWSRFIEPLQR